MGEARIYEDIQDYEAAKALFDEVNNNETDRSKHRFSIGKRFPTLDSSRIQ